MAALVTGYFPLAEASYKSGSFKRKFEIDEFRNISYSLGLPSSDCSNIN